MTINNEHNKQLVWVVSGASRGLGLEYVVQVCTLLSHHNTAITKYRSTYVSHSLLFLHCRIGYRS
jgi:hypothetical protein